MSKLHRIEGFRDNHIEGVVLDLSFETEHHGYWQCTFTGKRLQVPSSEPTLHVFPKAERTEIITTAAVVYKLVCPDEEISKELNI